MVADNFFSSGYTSYDSLTYIAQACIVAAIVNWQQ